MTQDINSTHATFEGRLDNLHTMIDWIFNRSLNGKLKANERNKIELALEEVLVNIIEHAYVFHPGKIEINCRVDLTGKLEIEILDWGIPFAPPSTPPPFPTLTSSDESIETSPLGCAFIHTIMDQVVYQREEDMNRTYLSVHLSTDNTDVEPDHN